MKITYTGIPADFLPRQKSKLEAKLQKSVKVLERRGEKEVHVSVSRQRHLHRVEITAHAFDHALAGAGSDADLVVAMTDAIDKLEKQVIRMREKWRDSQRTMDKPSGVASVASAPPKSIKPAKAAKPAKLAKPAPKVPQVFPVNRRDGHKPMTLEEAMLEIGAADSYLLFRDARTDKLSVLMRRPDGHFDLIEN
jgi:putative sigma-54 modulation protein